MKNMLRVLLAVFVLFSLTLASCGAKEDPEIVTPEKTEEESKTSETEETGKETEETKESTTGTLSGATPTVSDPGNFEMIYTMDLLGLPETTAFQDDYEEMKKWRDDEKIGVCQSITFENQALVIRGSTVRENNGNPIYSTYGTTTFLCAGDVKFFADGGEGGPQSMSVQEFLELAHAYNGFGLKLRMENGFVLEAVISS